MKTNEGQLRLKSFATAADENVFRGEYNGMQLEVGADKTWMHVTDEEGDNTVFFRIEGGQCEFENLTGADLTECWTDNDWKTVETAISEA